VDAVIVNDMSMFYVKRYKSILAGLDQNPGIWAPWNLSSCVYLSET